MKRNTHFIVPKGKFRLLPSSEEWLSEYQFGTRVARHLFCRACGVCSFYVPRSNPDGVAVTVHCLDPGTVTHVVTRSFDGQHWEEAYRATEIAAHSDSGGT
ncbi:hypothetical protein CLOM_g7272 [Closterium sp. NIES-68]|nr:hypothetical protein CLOM_g7272 [Closterium sp. NIES-68]